MVTEKEVKSVRRFVLHELRNEPDLSKLTLGILKKRYQVQQSCESLSPAVKKLIKQVVEEELIKMQENDKNESESETKKPQTKRKREDKEVESEKENESRTKKSRSNDSSSSSESEEKEVCETEHEDEEQIDSPSNGAKRELKKSEQKTNGNRKKQIITEDSTDEETNESEEEMNESNSDSPKQIMKKKVAAAKNEKTQISKASEEKKTPESNNKDESDEGKSVKSDNTDNSDSSDSEKGNKVSEERRNNDSDSSSLPSLEEKDNNGENAPESKKKKTVKRDAGARDQKGGNKSIVRLKRYITLCGVKRNYKKLLGDCRSITAEVAVLKKELEDLGVQGVPTIEKCKKVRLKREEAQELAGLDVGNIITTQGRPKRGGAAVWKKQQDPPSSAYQRILNSGSESEDESNTHRGRRKISEWTNLRGIISDDADSE